MKQILFVVLGLAVLVGLWYVLQQGSTITYVATVNDEVAALETELAELEAAVADGTLTQEEAAAAQERIITRINVISAAVDDPGQGSLTDEQRTQLKGGLERLKSVLVTYQATLADVEVIAAGGTLPDDTDVENDNRPQLNPQGKRGRGSNMGVLIAETIVSVESLAEDMIEDYNAEDTIPDEVTLDEFEEILEGVSEGAEDTEMVDDMYETDESMTDSEMGDGVLEETESTTSETIESEVADDTSDTDTAVTDSETETVVAGTEEEPVSQ